MKKAYLLNGVPPRPFWSTHAKLEEEYEKRIPAETKAASTKPKTQPKGV